jgi:hypothetical protein
MLKYLLLRKKFKDILFKLRGASALEYEGATCI